MRWSEFLLQFNLVIKFHPGRLGAKPDVLTYCWDVYNREGPDQIENLHSMFSQSQVDTSLFSSTLMLQAVPTVDMRSLAADIKAVIFTDPTLVKHLECGKTLNNPHWSVGKNGTLLHDRCIFVPESNNLCLWLLQAKYNHQLAEHIGQKKNLPNDLLRLQLAAYVGIYQELHENLQCLLIKQIKKTSTL